MCKVASIKMSVGLLLLLAAYALLIMPFTEYQRSKPFVEKVGYTPNVDLLKMVAADQKQSLAAALIFKVIVYYGTLVEKTSGKLSLPADYPAMSRTLHSAVKLDPCNMDAYYFGQAILVWDVGKVDVANELLVYGMKYRDWDFQLPYFAGFNYAYFLKDYANAAKYYRLAAELSGNDLFVRLAGRYMQESGQTALALDYLVDMAGKTRNSSIKKSFVERIAAFRVVQQIEQARDRFLAEKGRLPRSINELAKVGLLRPLPVDPYGGEFYLESDGRVRTTSMFVQPSSNTDSNR